MRKLSTEAVDISTMDYGKFPFSERLNGQPSELTISYIRDIYLWL